MKVELSEFPSLPERISRLPNIAYNLWWSWHRNARELFRRLDRTLWRQTQHNPVRMLNEIDSGNLKKISENLPFLSLYDSVVAEFDEYMAAKHTWFAQTYPDQKHSGIAYFCAEFGIHNSLPIYSGGLGLLAGDTCKEASDLGLPMVGIGALYPEGYFHQHIEADGLQEALYTRLATDVAPLLPVLQEDGSRLLVAVPFGDVEVKVAVWKVQVGRMPIYLLDTSIDENETWLRDVSARLYGGDQLVRLRQEIILGMGGIRVLRALGYQPAVFHLNEGHAAFAGVELLREFCSQGHSFEESIEKVRERVVFTTHTPVKAGHDEFAFHMMEEYFQRIWEEMGVSRESLFSLGEIQEKQSFSMTILSLRLSRSANGVSRKHGQVSREMWQSLWPDLPVDQVPITWITNGVHVPTWISPELVDQYERYIGPYWWVRHDDPAFWEKIFQVPDSKLWEAHLQLKAKLMAFIRKRAALKWSRESISSGHMVALGTLLDPEVLTIGFARRFATYKRATLIFQDLERLKKILHNPWRPVQLIFAGKAHPADEPGKFLLQQIFQFCTSRELEGHVAFVQDYEKHVAHYLVSGVDVWLNNPLPPMEASGTSGQKAALNGIPNLSVLDGWWYEGFNGRNGWSIGGEDDAATAENLYQVLEDEIVPLFYDRDSQGVPPGWVSLMKETIRSVTSPFSARRMMKEYAERCYTVHDERYSRLRR